MNTAFKFFFFVFFLTLASSVWGFANGAALGVVYPDVRDPYKKIFATIIAGIERETGAQVDRYILGADIKREKIQSDISENRNKVILALGLGGLKAVSRMKLDIPVVIGAILPSSVNTSNSIAGGISLMPDPTILFEKLKLLVPEIKTVSVIYNPGVNQILIESAKKSMRALNLFLDARTATNLREAALIYRDLVESIDNRTNAIWLLQDSTIFDSNSLLPSILEQAWKRRLIVFSSKLVHAKRGALFSVYPDNFKMGRELGKLAETAAADPSSSNMFNLRSLKLAVNMRTAKHLCINFSSRDERSFDLVFPRP